MKQPTYALEYAIRIRANVSPYLALSRPCYLVVSSARARACYQSFFILYQSRWILDRTAGISAVDSRRGFALTIPIYVFEYTRARHMERFTGGGGGGVVGD